MEINTQQMEVLLHLQERQTSTPRKGESSGHGFEALLNEQLANSQSIDPSGNMPGAVEAHPLLYGQFLMNNAELDSNGNRSVAALQSAFDQTSGALDMWDQYASILGGSTSDSALRDAYSLLEGIDSRVSQLKNNSTIGNDTELNGIVNELDIMTAIEKFKFNRGDYLA